MGKNKHKILESTATIDDLIKAIKQFWKDPPESKIHVHISDIHINDSLLQKSFNDFLNEEE